MSGLVDQALRRLDTALVWLEMPVRSRHYRWSAQEDAALRRWWGCIPQPELAGRISRILQQETGDPAAVRSINACVNRAQDLALPAYNGDAGEIALKRACDIADVPCHIARQAIRDGQLPAVRKGKQVYVTELDWSLWLVWYRERLLMQEEILNMVEGMEIVTKQEAMRLSGLCETHITRYLQARVIQAWLLPGIKTGRPGEWLVSRASVEAFMTARAEGRLRELLDHSPAYAARRDGVNQEVMALRRAGRLKKADPLTEPKSRYHRGCFTVQQVASHVGLSTQVVHRAIASGLLAAEVVVRGGRPRYAVKPKEARRYAADVAALPDITARRDTLYLRQIAEAGLLTVRDLAKRWNRSEATTLRWTRDLPSRKWGRYWVFELPVIEAFERNWSNE